MTMSEGVYTHESSGRADASQLPAGAPVPASDHGQLFAWRFVAPVGDTDINKHISNIAYVRWLQDCARVHSDFVGWTREKYIARGGFFAVRRHELDYLRPSHAGDEIIMTTWFEDFRPASATRVSTIARAKDGVLCVKARTTWVWLSLEGRPTKVPKEIQDVYRLPQPTMP